MEFINHTLARCRGEIFEGNMALLYFTERRLTWTN